MTPARAKEQLQAELTGLRKLAEITPPGPLGKDFLEQRVKDTSSALEQIETRASISPETEIFFGGPAVYGSQGIDAKFAADVLDSYQDMVTNDFASRQGALRRVGRRRGEAESKLFLTALPRGSMGLQLSQPVVTDFVTASYVAEAMDHIATLIAAAADSDESFDRALEVFHPRVIPPLGRFLESVTNASASCRIFSGRKDVELKQDQLAAARDRVAAATPEETTEEITGIFGGVLVHSWKFDFVADGLGLVSGWLSDDVSDEDAARMALRTGKRTIATVKQTSLSTTAGKKGPVYELLSVRPATPGTLSSEPPPPLPS